MSLFAAAKSYNLPLVAIGGITPENAKSVIEAGADSIAVINSLFAVDDPYQAASQLKNFFTI